MGNSDITKEKIIDETIKLIQELNGNTQKITIRKIAANSGVGVGLIHHYFSSKENLLEICVQRIISHVITAFKPIPAKESSPRERTKCVARQVMDFLMDNQEVSQISILGDMENPKIMDNTVKTILGFCHTLPGEREEDRKFTAFCLTVILQGAFLRRSLLLDIIGYDFTIKEQRDTFIDMAADRLTH